MPEIFQYDFMIRAFVGGVLVGALAPALGVFLVLRRLALIADSLSHVALTGVAFGLLTKTFPPIAGLLATSTAAVAIETVRLKRLMPGDVALAVVLYSALAVAVVVIGLAGGFNVDLFSYLFGSILTVNNTDLWLLAALAAVVITFVVSFYPELAQSSFDTDLARVSGADVPSQPLPRILHRGLGSPAEAVGRTRGVPERLGEPRQHRVHDPRVTGGGGVVVEVDGCLERHGAPRGASGSALRR